MKITIRPDIAKANSLKESSLITLKRLEEIDLEKYPSNTLKDYYDIIRSLMESLLYLEGIKIKGEGAHYETIEYVCKEHNLGETTRIYLQDMREYRNRISYEGFNIPASYIRSNAEKIKGIIGTLLGLLGKK